MNNGKVTIAIDQVWKMHQIVGIAAKLIIAKRKLKREPRELEVQRDSFESSMRELEEAVDELREMVRKGTKEDIESWWEKNYMKKEVNMEAVQEYKEEGEELIQKEFFDELKRKHYMLAWIVIKLTTGRPVCNICDGTGGSHKDDCPVLHANNVIRDLIKAQ